MSTSNNRSTRSAARWFALSLAAATVAVATGCNCGNTPPEVSDAGEAGGAGGGGSAGGGEGGGGGAGGGGQDDGGVDGGLSISVDDAAALEGTASNGTLGFVVRLSAQSSDTITVAYATSDGTAVSAAVDGGSDYAPATGTVTLLPGVTSQQVDVVLNADNLYEGDETILLTLSSPVGAALADATATGTLTDDDGPPSISVADVTVAEGTGTTGNAAVFTVTLSHPSTQSVTVAAATSDGTASSGSDYASASTTLTFAPGDVSRTLSVALTGDALDEADESFNLTLSAPFGATLADATAVATLTDDDAPPALSIADVSVSEGNSGATTATFTVTLGAPSGRTVTVAYSTGGGTATAGQDYTQASGTLTFAPGDTTQIFSVSVSGDTTSEANETVDVTLSSATNATIADGTAVLTITNDDAPLPSISVANAAVTEGNAGTTNLTFTVTLSVATTVAVTVDFATSDGTASATGSSNQGGQDYVSAAGTLTFPPGTTSQTVTVAVNADAIFEANETLTLTLANATNAVIGTATATGTITNDEVQPTITINNVNNNEGNAGTLAMAFTVTLSGPSQPQVTVDFATADGTSAVLAPATSGGSPTSGGADYVATSGALTFTAGSTNQFIAVTINGDVLDEPNELFHVNLTNASGATIADAQANGLIQDDDAPPQLSIDDQGVNEADTGQSTTATFNVTLSAPSGRQVQVNYQTTAGNATANVDYTSTNGTVTFAPGETAKTVQVNVIGDTTEEANETFNVNLGGAVNAGIADNQGIGTIFANDQPTPVLSINDVAVAEGDSGTTMATLTVTLSGSSPQTVTVAYATTDDTAAAGSDYTATSGTLTFPSGTLTQQLSVPVIGDTLPESNERLFVDLSAPTNAAIGDGRGQVTITNDDALPTLSIADAAVVEGAPSSGGTQLTFTVTLSAASGAQVTVSYATADGTGSNAAISGGSALTGGQDYVTTSGTLTFPPNSTSQTVTVTIRGDTLNEADEVFAVNLAAAVNATIADGAAIGTITNDDALPSISIADAVITEGNFGARQLQFVATLSSASGRTVTAAYAAGTPGNATENQDYFMADGTLTFGAGQTTATVTAQIVGDNVMEPDETFTVTLTNPTNATLSDGTATGTIANDD